MKAHPQPWIWDDFKIDISQIELIKKEENQDLKKKRL